MVVCTGMTLACLHPAPPVYAAGVCAGGLGLSDRYGFHTCQQIGMAPTPVLTHPTPQPLTHLTATACMYEPILKETVREHACMRPFATSGELSRACLYAHATIRVSAPGCPNLTCKAMPVHGSWSSSEPTHPHPYHDTCLTRNGRKCPCIRS